MLTVAWVVHSDLQWADQTVGWQQTFNLEGQVR
jgi:hypothetical protein